MDRYKHPQTPKASPGANAEVVIFQTSDGTSAPVRDNVGGNYTAVTLAFLLSQSVTVLHKWGPTSTTADGAMVTVNGSGDGVVAGTFFRKTYQIGPGRDRISVVAGSNAPAAASIAWELYSGPVPFSGPID